MTSATFHHSPAGSLRHWLHDVGQAAHTFADKLFAAQDRHFAALEVRSAAVVSDFAKAKSRRQLFAMASEYDNSAPSLAAEMRSIASRD